MNAGLSNEQAGFSVKLQRQVHSDWRMWNAIAFLDPSHLDYHFERRRRKERQIYRITIYYLCEGERTTTIPDAPDHSRAAAR
jgi:hypothetical protein